MLALAIMQGAKEIHLYGIDMSANEEVYGHQRAGAHFFITVARTNGIPVYAPPQSDLLRPPPLYGWSEIDPMYGKMRAREAELTARFHDALKREAQAAQEKMFLQGALDDVNYTRTTWLPDRQAIDLAYAQPMPRPEPEGIPVINEEALSDEVEIKPGAIQWIDPNEAPNDGTLKFKIDTKPGGYEWVEPK
jgi:hypothetical protein